MATPLYVVDAFASRPFAGNPAGVCLLASQPADGWMAAVAGEVNLSETAFCWPDGQSWRLRWFTPLVEVPLCGHATLATARVLWDVGRAPAGEAIAFETLSGTLTARPAGAVTELDFPSQPATAVDAGTTQRLSDALGVDLDFAGASPDRLLGEAPSAAHVRTACPDPAKIAALGHQGVILTAAGDAEGVDYVLRYFAPNAGIPEDPVTGSAQCTAGPHWAARTGRRRLVAQQVSRRGGTLYVGVQGERVTIGGHAVVVSRGELAPVAAPD